MNKIFFCLMTMSFAFSTIYTATSQSFDNQATDLLINSLIQFEQKNYLDNMNQDTSIKINKININKNLDLTKRSISCSLSILSNDLGDSTKTLSLLKHCRNDSIQNLYEELETVYNELFDEITNISTPLKPLDTLSKNFDEYFKIKKLSRFFQIFSWIFAILGFFIIYIHFFSENRKS